jgi:hypothetical protein
MPPSRGDTICGNVVIDALAPMQFGARAFGPVYLAHTPEEPQIWLTTIATTIKHPANPHENLIMVPLPSKRIVLFAGRTGEKSPP